MATTGGQKEMELDVLNELSMVQEQHQLGCAGNGLVVTDRQRATSGASETRPEGTVDSSSPAAQEASSNPARALRALAEEDEQDDGRTKGICSISAPSVPFNLGIGAAGGEVPGDSSTPQSGIGSFIPAGDRARRTPRAARRPSRPRVSRGARPNRAWAQADIEECVGLHLRGSSTEPGGSQKH